MDLDSRSLVSGKQFIRIRLPWTFCHERVSPITPNPSIYEPWSLIFKGALCFEPNWTTGTLHFGESVFAGWFNLLLATSMISQFQSRPHPAAAVHLPLPQNMGSWNSLVHLISVHGSSMPSFPKTLGFQLVRHTHITRCKLGAPPRKSFPASFWGHKCAPRFHQHLQRFFPDLISQAIQTIQQSGFWLGLWLVSSADALPFTKNHWLGAIRNVAMTEANNEDPILGS